MKHRLKLLVRDVYARVLFHTGLHRVVNRCMPRRMVILFGHCIEDDAVNGFLPRDMTMRESTLRRVLGWFGRRGYALCNVGTGMDALERGQGPSLVALSMDDGYRDNRTRLLPILSELGASATVFLESRPLDERRLNWTHHFHWVIRDGGGHGGPQTWAERFAELCTDDATAELVRKALEGDADGLAYRVKRALKYEGNVSERDRVALAIFEECGGDERALCDALYINWDDARALQGGGVELGGHTVSHAILSRLDDAEAATEIGACRERMLAELGDSAGRTFAYPFGRSWDYGKGSIAAARASGFDLAVNTHAGTNSAQSDRFQLRRLPVDDRTPLHLLVAEACGGFDLLRRFGVDLAE